MSAEPSILKLVYDSVREIRQATADIADEQSIQGRRIEVVLGRIDMVTHRIDAADAAMTKLEGRIGAVEERLHDLRRIAWILTIAGAMLVAIVTSVASDFAGRLFDPPTRPQHVAAPTATVEGS